ncbi:hypothetical protein M1N23_03975 [Dehalococcoidia bacterium]|nr:hypothetical protein [Dehalococcoidia bacterium]
MLEWSGLGVATDGIVSKVLAVADIVAPSFRKDGVARILEELVKKDLVG